MDYKDSKFELVVKIIFDTLNFVSLSFLVFWSGIY